MSLVTSGRASRRRRRRAIAVLALALGVATIQPVAPTVASAGASAVIVCPPSVNTFTWDGAAQDAPGHVGDGVHWADPYNWNRDCTPGLRLQPHDDSVTIPASASVFLDDGESAQLVTLTNHGSLTLAPGAVLEVSAASTSKNLTLHGLLAGVGTFTVTSRLDWVATPMGGSTQATRWCGTEDPCTSPAPVAGTTVIKPGATMAISGRGVNLSDQRVIENRGTTRVSGEGYIAANYGTTFRNLRASGKPAPSVVFENDGGYYQGFATAGFPLSRFANTGKLTKTGGLGVSVVDADFQVTDAGSPYTGTVEVHSGQLSIGTPSDDTIRSAKVQQGAGFGNGGPDGCDAVGDPGSCSVVQPTPSDPQVTSVELTKAGTTTSAVTIRELPDLVVPADRGVPVQIDTPNAGADTANPLRFRLLLDATLLHAGETAAGLAATVPVSRQANTSAPYLVLPSCGPSQNPTATIRVCVARTLSVTETTNLGTGDVVLVISSLSNSRYRIG